MHSIKQTTIQGFNEIVQTVKGIQIEHPEQEHYVSLVTFNGIRQNLVHFMNPVCKLEHIDDSSYQPDASTPLFDAIGFGINKLKQALEKSQNYNVLVTILTDGEENSSREFSSSDIKKLIEMLKLNRWTFTYIGTDHDVEKMTSSISINNYMRFNKNETEMKMMFEKEKTARMRYSRKISLNEETSEAFYGIDTPEMNNKNDNNSVNTEKSIWQKFFGI